MMGSRAAAPEADTVAGLMQAIANPKAWAKKLAEVEEKLRRAEEIKADAIKRGHAVDAAKADLEAREAALTKAQQAAANQALSLQDEADKLKAWAKAEAKDAHEAKVHNDNLRAELEKRMAEADAASAGAIASQIEADKLRRKAAEDSKHYADLRNEYEGKLAKLKGLLDG